MRWDYLPSVIIEMIMKFRYEIMKLERRARRLADIARRRRIAHMEFVETMMEWNRLGFYNKHIGPYYGPGFGPM